MPTSIYGVQSARKGGLIERVSGAVFYTVLNRLLSEPIPRNVLTARLMTQRYVRALVQHLRPGNLPRRAVGHHRIRSAPLEVVKGSRPGSSYSLRKRVSSLVSAVTSFSNRPLIYIFYLGAAVVTIATLAGVVVGIRP